MGGMLTNSGKWLGPALLCWICIAAPSWAAPPFTKASTSKNPAPPSSAAHNTQLDLRPPTLSGFAATGSEGYRGVSDSSEDTRFASLGAAMQTRAANRPEAMVQRFHREGLPIARLWEGHSALVSVGLSPRGKPGLWWVKKTH
jgi:hypothetical protein